MTTTAVTLPPNTPTTVLPYGTPALRINPSTTILVNTGTAPVSLGGPDVATAPRYTLNANDAIYVPHDLGIDEMWATTTTAATLLVVAP